MSDRVKSRRLAASADEATERRLLEVATAYHRARADATSTQQALAREIAKAVDDDGWSQLRVAKVVGISHQRISQLRRGQ